MQEMFCILKSYTTAAMKVRALNVTMPNDRNGVDSISPWWKLCPLTRIVTPGVTWWNHMAVSPLRLGKLEYVEIKPDHGHAR